MSAIGRNTLYNLAGLFIPLVLFVVTIPLYIRAIGEARYGVLAIVWLVLGLFGMLDLGLGRAATQKIASLAGGSADERRAALDTALVANIAIGAVGALFTLGATWFVIAHGMKLDPWLRAEALPVVPMIALGVPVVTTIGILSGALQGRERFLAVNRITIINGALFQILPLIVAWTVGPRLGWVVLAALLARVAAVLMLGRECRREFGTGRMAFRRAETIAMLRYGGWVTIAAALGMVVLFTDRFVIGAIIGSVAVATYVVALDATIRVTLLANALMTTMFPRFAGDPAAICALAAQSRRFLYAISTPIVAVGIPAAAVIFPLWLGQSLGTAAAPIAQICLIGAWANVFAKLGFTKLQANDEARTVALVTLVEALIIPALMVAAIWRFGIIGGAVVYCLRQIADCAALNRLAFGSFAQWRVFAGTLAYLAVLVAVGLATAGMALVPRAVIGVALALPTAVLALRIAPELLHLPRRLLAGAKPA